MQQDKPTLDRFLAWQERHPALNFLLVVTAPLVLLGALYLLTRLGMWLLGADV